jgi:molybdenum cofactor cytidylyltransferase
MGQPKALLPAAGDTFLQRAVAALRDGGCHEVTVVVRPPEDEEARRIASAALSCGARLAENPVHAPEQIDSLRTGLRSLRAEVEAAVVAPVDFPHVHAGIVMALIDAFRRTRAPIAVPMHRGKHGHPVLFARAVFPELLTDPLPEGARSVVHAHSHELVEVPVDEAGVLLDVNTPLDYQRIVGQGA